MDKYLKQTGKDSFWCFGGANTLAKVRKELLESYPPFSFASNFLFFLSRTNPVSLCSVKYNASSGWEGASNMIKKESSGQLQYKFQNV